MKQLADDHNFGTFWQRHTVTLLYLCVIVIAFGFLLYGQSKQADRLQAACERGNTIRVQINANNAVTTSFILAAAQTRDATAALLRKEGNEDEAQINEDAADSYRALLSGLTMLETVDCSKI